ncbi:hypothetical protein J3A83DRAFT_4254042 [Scleroderma citrinum]
MMPTIDEIEQYFEGVERIVTESFTAASFDLPNVREAINRLWVDITRYGPPGITSLPEIHVGRLGPFEVPPPPPPPLPKSLIERTGDWLKDHPWTVSGVVLSTVGVGLVVGYHVVSTRTPSRRRIKATATVPERRQVVVVLGGDHPLGLPLIMELESKGYIVVTSVSSPDSVGTIESKSHGFIRALVLDPNEPGTIPIFLRSLASTLSRRFPISAAGDPYVTGPYHPLLRSVISLLTMPVPSIHCTPAPLEQISLRGTYLPHLLSTHVAPLQTLQALLPLLRADAQRTRSPKSIIICLPAADARVGLPFSGVTTMSAAATLRAADVLRRELSAAHGTGGIRVVTVDVGAVGQIVSQPTGPPSMDEWTLSEKATYGAAFCALSETGRTRTPEDVSKFVDNLVGVVSAGTKTDGAGKAIYSVGVGLVFEKVKDWARGNRFSIGAGGTYTFASFLPARLLDGLLSLPQVLVGIRNALIPVPLPPSVGLEEPKPRDKPSVAPSVIPRRLPNSPMTDTSAPAPQSQHSVHEDELEADSDASSESSGDNIASSSVDSSWISLGTDAPPA